MIRVSDNKGNQVQDDSRILESSLITVEKLPLIKVEAHFQTEPETKVVHLLVEADVAAHSPQVQAASGGKIHQVVRIECKKVWPYTPFLLLNIKNNKDESIREDSSVEDGSTIYIEKQTVKVRISQLIQETVATDLPDPIEFQFATEVKTNTKVRALAERVITQLPPHIKKRVDATDINISFRGTSWKLREFVCSKISKWETDDAIDATFK